MLHQLRGGGEDAFSHMIVLAKERGDACHLSRESHANDTSTGYYSNSGTYSSSAAPNWVVWTSLSLGESANIGQCSW